MLEIRNIVCFADDHCDYRKVLDAKKCILKNQKQMKQNLQEITLFCCG
jgi:hypothetical protein